MKVAVESRLRTLALVLTALLILQAVWSGVRLRLMAEPEPISPAESSLKVRDVAYTDTDFVQAEVIRARPLFWAGREPFVDSGKEEKVEIIAGGPDNTAIKGVQLLGVYRSGSTSGIIVRQNGKRSRLRVNDKIGEWEFTLMSTDGAVFEAGDERRVLELTHVVPEAKKTTTRRTRNANSRASKNASKKATNKK